MMRRSTRIIAQTTGETSRFFQNSTNMLKQEPHTDPEPIENRRQTKKVKIEIEEEHTGLKQELNGIQIPPLEPSENHETAIQVKPEIQGTKIPLPSTERIKPKDVKFPTDPKISPQVKMELVDPITVKTEYIKLNIPDYNAPVILTEEEQKNLPQNFIPIYTYIKKMRAKIIAPVDTVGCAKIPITLDTEKQLTPINYRFQLLISLMLSSQTKDEINYKAMCQMKEYFLSQGFKEGICLEAIEAVEEKMLNKLIFSVGFHSRKAQYIKKAASILRDQHDGDIPNTLEGLIALPGVGPKMSYLTLQKAWNLNEGIGVDVHVDRLSKQFKWVNPKICKNPEITRRELQEWLPKSLWMEINPVLVGFGQSICLPKGRRCDLCSLSRTNLCPNVDRTLMKRVENLDSEALKKLNKTLRFQFINDIEDLCK